MKYSLFQHSKYQHTKFYHSFAEAAHKPLSCWTEYIEAAATGWHCYE